MGSFAKEGGQVAESAGDLELQSLSFDWDASRRMPQYSCDSHHIFNFAVKLN